MLGHQQWDVIEDEREMIATVDGKPYTRVIDGDFRWSAWTKAKNDQASP